MDDIKIQSSLDRRTYLATIEVILDDFAVKTQRQAELYLKELIANALKAAVTTQHDNLQRLIDNEINNQETKILIKNIIEQEIRTRVKSNIDDMFGDKNQ